MKTKIGITKLNGIVIPSIEGEQSDNINLAATINASFMSMGYIVSQDLFCALQHLSESQLKTIHSTVLPILQHAKGADVKHTPMYVNFPQEVIEADEVMLYMNAILHYWSAGQWKPESEVIAKRYAYENVQFIELGIIKDEDIDGVLTSILSSTDSISGSDKAIVEWFLTNSSTLLFPEEIPFKENLCLVAANMIERDLPINDLVSNAVDVLRVVTHMNGGDVSLAANTKFKSLPRKTRKLLCSALEGVANEEDLNRHRGKFVKLFHNLHVGDYSDKLYNLIKKARNNEKVVTFNGMVEMAIQAGNYKDTIALLATRPSEFARRLDHVLRLNQVGKRQGEIVESFMAVANQVPTRIIIQLMGHFKTRYVDVVSRVAFPKGNVQKALALDTPLKALPTEVADSIMNGLLRTLKTRFGELEPLGKVYVDPRLANCPVPSQQRSASDATRQVARGTRLPIGDDKNTLRFFIYWVGRDIDLSATLHDSEFNQLGHVSYTELKNQKYQSYHSGDITSAPSGASEFIDITMAGAKEAGARYVAMNVYVYSGPTFSEHDACYAGWMTRTKPNSNEIYDAKTVEQKIDLNSETKNSIPVVFDLVTREAIWADLSFSGRSSQDFGRRTHAYAGNNVENNRANITDVVKSIVTLDNKLTLEELFSFHAEARGEIVENIEDADTVFSLETGITPYDITTIQSDYVI